MSRYSSAADGSAGERLRSAEFRHPDGFPGRSNVREPVKYVTVAVKSLKPGFTASCACGTTSISAVRGPEREVPHHLCIEGGPDGRSLRCVEILQNGCRIESADETGARARTSGTTTGTRCLGPPTIRRTGS